MHEALVHALRLHVAEAEATEVAGAGRDARERMLGHSFHREGRDELRVPVEVVPDAHVAKLGVIGARQDLQKVVPFGDALVGRPRILQRTQLQLALEVPILTNFSVSHVPPCRSIFPCRFTAANKAQGTAEQTVSQQKCPLVVSSSRVWNEP